MSEARPLEEQVALVTGGASGIGQATTRLLSAAGAAVAIVDMNAEGTKAMVAELEAAGGRAMPVVADLTDLASIPGLVEAVIDQLGPIDILINCAAYSEPTTSVFDVDMELWDKSLTVCLTVPFLMMRLVGRSMVDNGRGGRIVNVSSSSAFRARFSKFAYGAAKAGLVQLTRSVAAELGPLGINVNAVAPGLTNTPAIVNMGDPQALIRNGPLANLLGRLNEADDVAQVILFLCLPASRQITAQTIHVSAGAVV